MFAYIKAAFWYPVDLPALGALPVNALLFSGLLILGLGEFLKFGHAGFWLLAAGLEVLYLYLLASHQAFQAWVDDNQYTEQEEQRLDELEWRRKATVASLNAKNRGRFQILQQKIKRIRQIETANSDETYLLESNQRALQKLQWMYAKLLAAEENIDDKEGGQPETSLQTDIQALEIELAQDNLSATAKESKQATLEILQKRLDNYQRLEQYREEINSDLARIEAQVELALENAKLSGKPEAISDNIGLVSSFLQEMQSEFYDDYQKDITDMEGMFK